MKTEWIDPHSPELPGFGLAQVKAEGTTVFYDFDGYDPDAERERLRKLRKRFWQTKRVKREIADIKLTLVAHLAESMRRTNVKLRRSLP